MNDWITVLLWSIGITVGAIVIYMLTVLKDEVEEIRKDQRIDDLIKGRRK